VKNADHQRRRDEEVACRADGDLNAPHRACRNLEDEFNMVGTTQCRKTPSTNLAVVFNELEKLPPTLEL
jgi:hypothetical protein